jgi:hypothetical protein
MEDKMNLPTNLTDEEQLNFFKRKIQELEESIARKKKKGETKDDVVDTNGNKDEDDIGVKVKLDSNIPFIEYTKPNGDAILIMYPSKKNVDKKYEFLVNNDIKRVACLHNILHFGNPKNKPMEKYDVICELVSTNEFHNKSSSRLECTVKGLPNLFTHDPWSKEEEKTIMKVKLWGVIGANFQTEVGRKAEKGKKTIIKFKRLALTKYNDGIPHLTSVDGLNSKKTTNWKIYTM